MLTIGLEQLHFHAFIGVYEEEKTSGNDFLVDLTLLLEEGDLPIAQLSQTVDYTKVYYLVAEEMKKKRDLLETVAQNCVNRIKNQFPQLSGIEFTIRKLHPPLPGKVGASKITLSKTF